MEPVPFGEIERLLSPAKAPTVFGSTEAFIDALFVGKHVDEILVLRGGLSKLGLANAIRRDVLSATENSRTVPEFASRLGAAALDELDGRVYYWTSDGRERTLKRDRDGNLYRSVAEKLCAAAELASEDAEPAPTPAEGAVAGLTATGGLYIAELARRRKRQHACCPGERSRTLATRDVQDILPHGAARVFPSWDRGHAFVGSAGTGSSVHVDQVCWSNVGKNFAGRKALAIWPAGRETRRILDRWYRSLILRADARTGALPAEAVADLATASRLAVVEPGDVFVLSGANAHATIVLEAPPLPPPPLTPSARRSGCLSLTAFESFVNFNQDNLRAFLLTGTDGHDPDCAMREDDLADFKFDVADRLFSAVEWVRGSEPPGAAARGGPAAARARSHAPPMPHATRGGRALAERMRGAVLAAAELLRTDRDIDERMRRLEGRARAQAEREPSSDGSDGAQARHEPRPQRERERGSETAADRRSAAAGAQDYSGDDADGFDADAGGGPWTY